MYLFNAAAEHDKRQGHGLHRPRARSEVALLAEASDCTAWSRPDAVTVFRVIHQGRRIE